MATILVVEDDRNVQQMLAAALEGEGFDVVCERDGAQAVAEFEKNGADAIILDVLLPGMNGFQVAERVRALPGGDSVPIVMTSGIYRGKRHHDGAQSRFGLTAYIEKPFQIEQVLEPLRAALGGEWRDDDDDDDDHSPTLAAAPPPIASTPASPATMAPRMAMRGQLQERSLPWVVGEILRRRATGLLVLSRDGRCKEFIYVRDGAVVGSRSRSKDHWLGNTLRRSGALTQRDLDVAIATSRSSRRRLSRIFVEFLGSDTVRTLEHQRVLTALTAAFAWDRGEFRFYLRDRVPEGLTPPSLAPVALLYHCVKDGLSAVELARELALRLEVRPVTTGDFARSLLGQLPEAERAVIANLNGALTIRDVIAQQHIDDVGALLLAAMCAGVILPATSLPQGVPPPNQGARPSVGAVPVDATLRRDTTPIDPRFAREALRTPIAVPLPTSPAPAPGGTLLGGSEHSALHRLRQTGRLDVPEASSQSRSSGTRETPGSGIPQRPMSAQPTPMRGTPRSDAGATTTTVTDVVTPPADLPGAEEVRTRLAALEKADHWMALGVERAATPPEIRSAYHKLAKMFHPDRYAFAAPEHRELADKLFARMTEANRTLSDATMRAAYEASLKRNPDEANAAQKLARVVGAEKSFREGELEMKRRGYEAAIAKFEEAIRLYHDEGEYHAWLGYALALGRPTDATSMRRAGVELSLAKDLNPNCARAFYYQGLLYKNLGKLDLAEREFRQTIEIDPKDVDATREIRLMAMRREKSSPPKKK